ncbi:MAG: GntR family transcriptional regulator [bacterium]|nr:GntR family transcriptional regulator [bacterium]
MALNKTDALYDAIVKKIAAGEYEPDSFLREEELSKAAGVSRTVVRQALQRLHGAGLVRLIPNTGAIVVRATLEDAMNYIEARIAVEGMAAGLFAERASEEDLRQVEQLVLDLEKVSGGDLDTVQQFDAAFHDYIMDKCGNAVLKRIMDSTRLQFMEWSIARQWGYHGPADAADTHREILTALQSRDRETARRAMEKHLSRSRESIMKRFGWSG